MRSSERGIVRPVSVLALTLALLLAPTACGDDDGSSAGVEVLSAEEQEQVDERLRLLVRELAEENSSIVGGGFMYVRADRVVTGYPSDWQTPLERCQAVADALGELDGPAGVVPIRIIDPHDGDQGTFDVVAAGRAGETCS
jgi:hypothetical protein